MITYTAAYSFEGEICLGEVLDFPGTVSFGNTLEEARTSLSAALLDMAETNLSLSEPLPKPLLSIKKPDADIIEPIYLLLHASNQIDVQPLSPAGV
ncbi:MAG: type II toxin-antitoxin system HicB family antitoxin [Gemmatales bacterium]